MKNGSPYKFAAIDIGSNAIRLLFTQVFETKARTVFKKDSLFRVPIRLGEDVFITRNISEEKSESLKKTMMAFKYLIEAYKPIDYMACATAAMREAENGAKIAAEIKSESGININIVDGKREAEIIYLNHIADQLDEKGHYLYIDVGGGSTELTMISETIIVNSQSFNLGTVRILQDQASITEWMRMKDWVKENTAQYPSITGIGSGGNINKIFKMSLNKDDEPLHCKNIKKIFKYLNSYTVQERIEKLGLRPDRADVIIPATQIFIRVLKWANIEELLVPQIGLSDGIIHVLYEKHKNNRDN